MSTSQAGVPGVQDAFDINLNNTFNQTSSTVRVRLNDKVGDLINQIKSLYSGMNISVDFAGNNLNSASFDRNQLLYEVGLTPGSTLDIIVDNPVQGGIQE